MLIVKKGNQVEEFVCLRCMFNRDFEPQENKGNIMNRAIFTVVRSQNVSMKVIHSGTQVPTLTYGRAGFVRKSMLVELMPSRCDPYKVY